MKKSHILLIPDKKGWVIYRHAKEIRNRLQRKYDFTIVVQDQLGAYNLLKYDLIYLMDSLWQEVEVFKKVKKRVLLGVRGEFYWQRYCFSGAEKIYYEEQIKSRASFFHTVCQKHFNCFNSFAGIPIFNTSHGVNLKFFDPTLFCNRSVGFTGKMRVGSLGATYSGGEKGVDWFLKACKEADVDGHHSGSIFWKDVPLFYNGIDVYVCFSASEGQNNPIMEAGAMGVPVISTITGAAPEMVFPGKTGFLVGRTVADLVTALMFAKLNRDHMLRMGRALREEIVTNWSWDVRIKGFETMFDSCLEQI